MSANEYFATRFKLDLNRKKVWKILTPYFQRFIDPNDTLIELGAGYCYFINEIQAKRKIAIDLFENIGQFANDEVEVHVGNALQMDFMAAASADVIFASNFLEHLDWLQLKDLVTEMRRVLKPGGRVIIMQPNFRIAFKNYFDDYTHKTIFTDRSVVDWFESEGFRTKKKSPKFMPFSVKQTSSFLIWLIPIYLRSPIKPLAGQMMFVFERNFE